MKLYALRIFVDDLAPARHFYRDILGLPIQWDHETSAFGVDAGVSLIIETVAKDAPADDRELVGRFVGCSLLVDDIDAEFARLKAAGVSFAGPPKKQYWGGTLAHFTDPSGNTLTLVGS